METDVARTLQQQRDWYGAPLGEVFEGLCGSLGVSQAALARLLGLSPAMVSQLRNGQRAKIANPAAAHRLSRLIDLVAQVDAGATTPQEALAQAEVSREDTTAFGRLDEPAAADQDAAARALRAAAPADVLVRLAETADPDAPDLARLLRHAARDA
ncbi:helix-turn-helix domain-containing protein [Jannaschia sp. R86511]|uniref:helix-turn-helix domain-containing protein n=1 Tax=Jannaschia sp. R86511 TaxID=3093853 RepID=UPI0036D3DF09